MCRSSHQGVEVRAEVRGKTQRTGKFMLMNASRDTLMYRIRLYNCLTCSVRVRTIHPIKTHQSSNQNTRHGSVCLKFFAACALKGMQSPTEIKVDSRVRSDCPSMTRGLASIANVSRPGPCLQDSTKLIRSFPCLSIDAGRLGSETRTSTLMGVHLRPTVIQIH